MGKYYVSAGHATGLTRYAILRTCEHVGRVSAELRGNCHLEMTISNAAPCHFDLRETRIVYDNGTYEIFVLQQVIGAFERAGHRAWQYRAMEQSNLVVVEKKAVFLFFSEWQVEILGTGFSMKFPILGNAFSEWVNEDEQELYMNERNIAFFFFCSRLQERGSL